MKKPTDKAAVGRRRSIKILASGGAIMATGNLPHQWSKPVVESVMLPAHAQTSTGTIFTGSSDIADTTRYWNGEALVRLMNTFVPAAQAAEQVQSGRIKLAVLVGENNSYQFFLKAIEESLCPGEGVREMSSMHTGTGVLGAIENANGTNCNDGFAPGEIKVVSNGNTLQATGHADCMHFNITLSAGGNIPRASSCKSCPGGSKKKKVKKKASKKKASKKKVTKKKTTTKKMARKRKSTAKTATSWA